MAVGDLTSGATQYNIPTADAIVAAYTTAGVPLATGDFFTIYLFRGNVGGAETNALTIGLASGATPCTFATGVSTLTVGVNSMLQLRFEVTNVATPAIRVFAILG